MTDVHDSSQPTSPRKSRHIRSASESLLSIALGLQAVLMFFVTMTAFGLRVVPAAVALAGGAALLVLFVVAAWLVRYPAGVWFGWLLQLVLIATGIVMTLMYFIGAGFAALWIFCFVTGRRLDARKIATTDSSAKETP